VENAMTLVQMVLISVESFALPVIQNAKHVQAQAQLVLHVLALTISIKMSVNQHALLELQS
jgi:hypothetical protein